MKISQVEKSINTLEKILKINDNIFPLKRFIPYCELQLGKRNLYPNISSIHSTPKNSSDNLIDSRKRLNILLNIFSYADGKHDILDIANITNYDLNEIVDVLQICLTQKLIKYPK